MSDASISPLPPGLSPNLSCGHRWLSGWLDLDSSSLGLDLSLLEGTNLALVLTERPTRFARSDIRCPDVPPCRVEALVSRLAFSTRRPAHRVRPVYLELSHGATIVKTDEYFYEFFRTWPGELLRLVGLNLSGSWRFESVTVKQRKRQEKRLDGLLFRSDGQADRVVFSEFQGYLDRSVYWRALRSLAMYQEYLAGGPVVPILLVFVFLDPAFDPGFDLLTFNPPHQLLRVYLPDALRELEGDPGPLVVFQPLVARDPAELRERAPAWLDTIQSLKTPEKDRRFLMEALMYAIVERFPAWNAKELVSMFTLTPLEETLTFKNIVKEYEAKAEARGERIGQVQLLQQLLGRPVTPREELGSRDIEQLDELVRELKALVH